MIVVQLLANGILHISADLARARAEADTASAARNPQVAAAET
jgi:hypothetical protein